MCGRVGEWERGEWESGRENWGEGGERTMIPGFRVYLARSISICKVLGSILNTDVRRERGKKKEGKKGEEGGVLVPEGDKGLPLDREETQWPIGR